MESPRSRLAEKLGAAAVVRLSVLPVSVPVTVAEAAFAAAGAAAATARAAIEEIRKRLGRMEG